MKYLCENCKFNNNGWCKQKKMNGLKAKNIQECESFRKTGTTFSIKRESKDFYGQELVLVKINDEVAEMPIMILENFIKDKATKNIEVNIPD
jgi:hypothetical protein